MDRLTRDLLGQTAQGRGPRWMPMDLYREGDHFVANMDLPGVDPGSVDIDVEGNKLTIRAERTLRDEDDVVLSEQLLARIGHQPGDGVQSPDAAVRARSRTRMLTGTRR